MRSQPRHQSGLAFSARLGGSVFGLADQSSDPQEGKLTLCGPPTTTLIGPPSEMVQILSILAWVSRQPLSIWRPSGDHTAFKNRSPGVAR